MLDLSATGCQICMRGRSPQEIANDARRLKEAERRRKLLPFKILGLLLLLGGAGWLYARYQEPIARAYAAITGKVSGAVEKMQDPRYYANRGEPQDAPAPPPAPPPEPPAPAVAAPGSPAPVTPPVGTMAAPAPASASAAARPEPTWELPPPPGGASAGAWLVRGFVYDLATARPLAEARLRFVAVEDEAQQAAAETDRDGYYHLRLPRRRTYRTTVLVQGYRTFPLEDGEPPYRTMTAAERRRVIKEALDYSSDAATLSWNENLDEIRQDLALVPEPRPAR